MNNSNKKYMDSIDAYAYMVAVQQAELRDAYLRLHVKPKPWWLPERIWYWFLGKILVLNEFRK